MSYPSSVMPIRERITKFLIGILPVSAQVMASKYYFFKQIKNRQFKSAEIEWEHLNNWVSNGDWTIDVGANIGRYTLKMSELVGSSGQVVSIEPLKSSFDMLTHFVTKGRYKNITLLNIAATDDPKLVCIQANAGPRNYIFETFTQSNIQMVTSGHLDEKILALNIDSLNLPHKIKLVKIDVEGHEFSVIKGMTKLIERDHPVLIIEDTDQNKEVTDYISKFNYEVKRLTDNGRNLVFIHNEKSI